MKKFYLFAFLVVLLASSVSAYDLYQSNDTIDFKFSCDDLISDCNLTLINPQGSVLVNNQLMTNSVGYHNYTTTTSNITGIYKAYLLSDGNITEKEIKISENGKDDPSGIVVIFFSALFIIIIVGMMSLLLHSVFHFIALDFDAKDLIYNVSAYFGLFATYILGIEYLGNAFINSFLLFLIEVGAVTTLLLPIMAFAISFIKERMEATKKDH